jgi:hypothetical protein
VPIGQWFQSGALSLNGSVSGSASHGAKGSAAASYGATGMNRNFVKERLRRHTLGQHDDRAALWCIWMLDRSPLANSPDFAPSSETPGGYVGQA